MLLVERQHILVLANEVIVYTELELGVLVNIIDISAMHLRYHIGMTLSQLLLAHLDLLTVFDIHRGTSIPLSLYIIAESIQIFLQFSIVSIDKLAK